MISNEERREAARKLREKHEERTRPGMFEPQDMGMQVWTYLKDLESCLPDGDSAFIVLADLIEPSGYECAPGECPLNVRHDNDRIDREALMSLADECDSVHMHKVARRIREALGAVE